MTPAPIWGLWWLLLLPLVAAVAVAYKATKCATPSRLAWEATRLTGLLLAFLVAAGLVLAVTVEWVL